MTYQEILKSVGYPPEVLVLDFETYFDKEYSLSKMSTIEYVRDPRFDFTGLGIGWLNDNAPEFHFKPAISFVIRDLQDHYRENLEQITVVAKNCKFDITILSTKFGIIPPYIIDIDDLLRYYDARMSHHMKDVAPMFGLQPKGDTKQFKGLHYEEMDKDTKSNLKDYGLFDISIESGLFKILLPKITNPTIELLIARHTLDLYLRPHFAFDFKKAGRLEVNMQIELEKVLEKVSWVQAYA